MLIEHAGQLVTREQLSGRLWPGTVSMDFDHGLAKAVLKIRRALGDLADSPRYVETLERRGYRFLARVEPVEQGREDAEALADPRATITRLVWAGRSIPLVHGGNLIGRDADALVWVDSPEVSRRHAQVLVTGGTAILEDLGSKNGTHLNDCRLDTPALLNDGDRIRVGPALLRFRCAPSLGPTTTAID